MPKRKTSDTQLQSSIQRFRDRSDPPGIEEDMLPDIPPFLDRRTKRDKYEAIGGAPQEPVFNNGFCSADPETGDMQLEAELYAKPPAARFDWWVDMSEALGNFIMVVISVATLVVFFSLAWAIATGSPLK
jgi:hypothetical protein